MGFDHASAQHQDRPVKVYADCHVHLDLTNLTTGERPRANHPSLVRVARFAGQHHLPVAIHHNIAPISRSADEVKLPYYLDEFMELVDYCRAGNGDCVDSTIFIWCHSGISRRIVIKNLPFWVDEVLTAYPAQVYIDLSWVVLNDYILKDLDTWVELIKRHPNKFMIGSDVVGQVSQMGDALKPYDKWRLKIRIGPMDAQWVNLYGKEGD